MELGWLSPTGEFIKCNLMDHLFVAKEIADKLKYPVYDNNKDRMIHDDDRLYNHGWAHITRSLLGAHEYIINWTQHLTSEQKIKIYRTVLRKIFKTCGRKKVAKVGKQTFTLKKTRFAGQDVEIFSYLCSRNVKQ